MLQYFPNITGSLQVTGSVSVSGSITATGGIIVSGSIASASYSSNSELLDNLDSTAFVFTSSFNTYSSSMSSRVGNIEGNYATTGSNIFMGAQTVCANITSTGTIIAQTLNVQQVTSSIVYSSGSNIFGCLSTDVQQMTGSLRVTGSGNHWFQAGCVGIGTTTPTQRLHISGSGGSLTFGVDQANTSIIRGNATANFDLNNEGGGCTRLYGSEVQLRTSTVDPAVIIKNTGETCFACSICMPRAYIANCLLINQTSSLLDVTTKVEMSGIGSTFPTSQASYNLFANHGNNSTWIGYLVFNKSRGTTQGSVTAVADGDSLGMVRFNGADGSEQIRTAEIYAQVDGAVSKCCVPSRIVFATAGNNLNGPVERFRITSTGISSFSGLVCATNIISSGHICTTTADAKNLDIGGVAVIRGNGGAYATHYLTTGAANVAKYIQYDASGNTKNLFDAGGISYITGGNFGVGISPSYRLDVCSADLETARFSRYCAGTGISNGQIAQFVNLAASAVSSYIYIGSAPGLDWKIGKNVTNVASNYDFTIVDSNNNIRLRIDGSGTTCITGTVCAPSGIKYGGGNCILNNYDEGTWTIVATGSSSGSGNVGTGTYTRVGRLVTATFLINNQTFPSYSGTLRLSLPHTVGQALGGGTNLSYNAGGVYFYPYSAWGAGVTNFTYLQAVALNSTSYVSLAISCVNGDLQTTIANTNSSTSGAAGLYLRFTITYEV